MIDLSTKTYRESTGPTTWLSEFETPIIAANLIPPGNIAAGAIPAAFEVGLLSLLSTSICVSTDQPVKACRVRSRGLWREGSKTQRIRRYSAASVPRRLTSSQSSSLRITGICISSSPWTLSVSSPGFNWITPRRRSSASRPPGIPISNTKR